MEELLRSMFDVLSDTRAETIRGLEEVERRVLWLATLIVHEANKKKDPAGIKVGGHQASSASCVSLMTSLYFKHLRGVDRIAVKPHASPVLYAIQYLLGRIPVAKLSELRAYQGLQAYPSQTKNPEFVDYSTGSVGLGATAVSFSALTAHYLKSKDLLSQSGRFWAVVGDAELDEGNVWEALAEPLLDDVPGIRWVVDLNRQSLDRVVPGIRAVRLKGLFEANGWRVIDAKYGRQLAGLFNVDGGSVLRRRIDEMSNEEFQSILSGPAAELAVRLTVGCSDPAIVTKLISDHSPAELHEALSNLGGHDHETLGRAFQQANAADSPAVVFAYTIKGWGLPFAGNPMNHSALLNEEQMAELADRLEVGPDHFATISPESSGGRIVREAITRLRRPIPKEEEAIDVPVDVGTPHLSKTSTQEAFGRVLLELRRAHPEVARRVVTVAPDVSISTSLAGWINKVGSWRSGPSANTVETNQILRWSESQDGQHFELGISEMNLFELLGQLGLSANTFGSSLIPIGTVYDTFISRGLDALVYGLYCGSSFVLIGTPSGVSLAPEGGAHQSTFTPGLGVTLPNLVSFEPCYAQEVEWALLEGMRRSLNQGGSTYLRLSTLPVDQSPAPPPSEDLRRQVLAGAYRLVDRRNEPDYDEHSAVLLFAVGTAVPSAVAASETLIEEGVFASVINVTSADQLFSQWHTSDVRMVREARYQPNPFPDLLSNDEVGLPAVMVADGHPHNLAFIGTALNVRAISLGVSGFGESGTVADLFRKHDLHPDSIVNAAIAVADARVAAKKLS